MCEKALTGTLIHHQVRIIFTRPDPTIPRSEQCTQGAEKLLEEEDYNDTLVQDL